MNNSLRFTIRLICFGILIAIALYAFPGSVEIDEQVFVVNMGIDRLDNGMLRVTVQIPSGEQSGSSGGSSGGSESSSDSASSSSGGEKTTDEHAKQLEEAKKVQTESRQNGYLVATTDGVNYGDAMNMMSATLPRIVNLSQVKQVIISEVFASEPDFIDTINKLIYYNEFYNAADLIVCEGSAEEFIREQQLMLGARLSKAQEAAQYSHLMMSFVPKSSISDVYYGLNSNYYDAAATLCATNLFTSKSSSNTYASGTVYAGNVARSGANLNEYMGCALLDDTHMVGKLTGYETQLLHILQGNLKSLLALYNNHTAQIMQRSGPRITIDTDSLTPRISIGIDLYMQSLTLGASAEDIEKAIENDLLKLILKCQSLRVDPFGFGRIAVMHFSDFDDWSNYNWRDRFSSADIGLDVNIIRSDV